MEIPSIGIKYNFGMKFEPLTDKAPKTPYKPRDAPAMIKNGKANVSINAIIILDAAK